MIATEDVTKAYGGRRVLDGLRLQAGPGAISLLVGANGCGKSTTLRLVAGLSTPDRGRILIDGCDTAGDSRRALAGLSYLPQSPRFHPRLTVAQLLRFYGRLRDLPDARCAQVARDWQLDDVRDVPSGRLSGGMRQRLALAVLMLPEAPILVLDEPGLSLDPDWRRFLQLSLERAARDGRTVLVATHLLGEWEGRCDACLLLEGGRIRRTLSPDRLRDAFPFAQALPPRIAAAGMTCCMKGGVL
jgi:ABC-2 type transport system ATP-binding protein